MEKVEQTSQPTESLQVLRGYVLYFEKQAKIGIEKAQRIEMLMKRHSMKKLSSQKKQRMVKRHIAAQEQASSSLKMLDELNLKLATAEAEKSK